MQHPTTKYHVPVLLNECIEALKIKPNGTYIDFTFGGGGHSKGILECLGRDGRLIAFDRDADALDNIFSDEKRLTFIHANYGFAHLYLQYLGIEKADGVLADFGLSSHQIDQPERGFSFMNEAHLDMRMTQSQKISAVEVLNMYDEKKLFVLLKRYGELKKARAIANTIVKYRENKNINSTQELIKILEPLFKNNRYKEFAKIFQALRIEVNDEIGAIKSWIKNISPYLVSGARVCVISYHSLEDRLIKNYFRSNSFDNKPEKDMFGNILKDFEVVNKSPIVPTTEEIALNPRARSAKLRVAEKI